MSCCGGGVSLNTAMSATSHNFRALSWQCCTYLRSRFCLAKRETTFGVLAPPLGLARQAILELVESVVLTNSAFVFDAVLHSSLMGTLIDLFFQYKWNNFAHQSVFNIIATVLPTTHEGISRHIMEDCHLVEHILEAEERNKENIAKTGAALGYIGHLTVISSLIDNLANQNGESLFAADLQNYPSWGQYMSETVRKRRDDEAKKLGGIHYEGGSETDTDGDSVHDADGEIVRHQCDDDEGDDYSYEGEYDDEEEEEEDNSGEEEGYNHDEDENEDEEGEEDSDGEHADDSDSVPSVTSEMETLSLESPETEAPLTSEEPHQDKEGAEELQENSQTSETQEEQEAETGNPEEPKDASEASEEPQKDTVTTEDSTQ